MDESLEQSNIEDIQSIKPDPKPYFPRFQSLASPIMRDQSFLDNSFQSKPRISFYIKKKLKAPEIKGRIRLPVLRNKSMITDAHSILLSPKLTQNNIDLSMDQSSLNSITHDSD